MFIIFLFNLKVIQTQNTILFPDKYAALCSCKTFHITDLYVHVERERKRVGGRLAY